jgi:hypothetical protein
LLEARDYAFTTAAERDQVCKMKEKLASVALDFEDELEKARATKLEKAFQLPDGQVGGDSHCGE